MPWLKDHFDDYTAMEDAHYLFYRIDEPLAMLRTMATLRRWGDEINRLAVEDARQAGATWEEIAEAMRRSKQSVHRQYASGDDPSLIVSDPSGD